MNEQGKPIVSPDIPMNAIGKGRGLDDILSAWMEIYERAKTENAKPGMTDEEIYTSTLMCAVLRIYLLGVEDGMKGDGE